MLTQQGAHSPQKSWALLETRVAGSSPQLQQGPSQQKAAGRGKGRGKAPALDHMEQVLRQIDKELSEEGSAPDGEAALRMMHTLSQFGSELQEAHSGDS